MHVGLISLQNPGNLRSVSRCLNRCGHESFILNQSRDFGKYNLDAIILPGVGSFEKAISLLKTSGFDKLLLKLHNEKFKIIGICLGFQLLTKSSSENKYAGEIKGLNIFHDIKLVDICSEKRKMNLGLKRLYSLKDSQISDCKYFYFMHRFGHIIGNNLPDSLHGWCFHSDIKLAAICKLNNTWGIQFHPEKSGQDGDELLDQILRYDV